MLGVQLDRRQPPTPTPTPHLTRLTIVFLLLLAATSATRRDVRQQRSPAQTRWLSEVQRRTRRQADWTSDATSLAAAAANGGNEKDCKTLGEMAVCNATRAEVCRNRTCVSACAARYPPLQPCVCAAEEDSYCYLCCGSAEVPCRPAHLHSPPIYKPNGEMWEREMCRRCRSHEDGWVCDDRDHHRHCRDGKCVANICDGKPEGSVCSLSNNEKKICTDGVCRDPCKDHDPLLMTGDCDLYSEDRCQLCCVNLTTKRCSNAHLRHRIRNRDGRMIFRVGLSCRRGLTCNKYGICAGRSLRSSPVAVAVAALGVLVVFVGRFNWCCSAGWSLVR